MPEYIIIIIIINQQYVNGIMELSEWWWRVERARNTYLMGTSNFIIQLARDNIGFFSLSRVFCLSTIEQQH